MRLLIKKYWKTIIWSIIMCYLLFTPGSTLPKSGRFEIPHFDKLAHFAMFAILIFVYQFEEFVHKQSIYQIRIAFPIMFLFGVFSEVIQFMFVPGREGSIFDFTADVVGLLTGILFFRLV